MMAIANVWIGAMFEHSSGKWFPIFPTWPTSRRRRLPIGLHRDPLRNWVVSDMTMACCKPLEVPQEWLEEWHEDMARRSGMRIATEFSDYWLRRDYAKVRGEWK